MRRLMLLRHAKSDWSDRVTDFERPLAKRGEKAAPMMGAYMAAEHLVPDCAMVSPARRARDTWALVAPAFRETVKQVTEPRLYEAEPEDILAAVRGTKTAVKTLMVVGHNPGFEDLAVELIGHGDRYAFARLKQKFPTAALAVIDFAVNDWGQVKPHDGRLDRFVTPRMLGGDDD